MARTKNPTAIANVVDVPFNEAVARADFDALAVVGAQQKEQAQQDLVDLCELAGDVGALRALELTRNLVAAATIRVFQKVRDSRKIKDLPIRQPDGSVATATNLDDFCRLAFGKNRAVMFEAAETLEALGERAYEAASRLGLNRSALRATRALPPEKLEVVRTAIADGSTKAEVLSVIEDLAEKVQQAEAATTEAQAELKASEEVLVKKNARIDKLEREAKRFRNLPPYEALAALKKDATSVATEAEAMVLGGLRQALIALNNHGEERGQHGVFMAGLLGQVQAQLNALREEFNLPDVSAADSAFDEGGRQAIREGLAQFRAKAGGAQ